jgi:hypothetical protein
MAKDAYYFPHDSNAKDDPKSIMLIEELGLEGYGIFWVLIETLRDQPEYKAPMSMLPALGRRYNSSGEKFRAVVSRYGLFEVDNNEFFFSKSFGKRMEAIDKKRKELSDAGKLGNKIRWQSGSESGGDGVAIAIKGKESKSNQRKGNDVVAHDIPTLELCEQTAEMRGFTKEQGRAYFYFRDANGWTVARGKEGNLFPIMNWTSDMANVIQKGYLEKEKPKDKYGNEAVNHHAGYKPLV